MPTAKTAALPPAAAVRVTVEADAAGDSDDSAREEVEDIGSETESAAEEQEEQPRLPSKRRKPEASGAAGLANVLRDLLAKSQPAAASGSGCLILAKALTDRQRFASAVDAKAAADKDEGGGEDAVASAARRRRLLAERRRWLAAGREKPSGGGGVGVSREAERELQRLACRGVVQLFNAVRTQQRALDARLAGKSEAGRQRVLSSLSRADFLDMLAGRRNRKSGKDEAADQEEADASPAKKGKQKKKKSWGVLSEDYLVKPTLTMKDWDKASSDGSAAGEEGEAAEMMEQDDD